MSRRRPTDPNWLNGDEAAALLGQQRNRYQRLVWAGAVPGEHPGGTKRRYFRRELIEFLREARPNFADPREVADVVRGFQENE